jgi:hypothetical protein
MTLNLISKSLQNGLTGAIPNILLEIVHAVIEQFHATDKKQNDDTASLKEMVARLEDRTSQNLATVHHALSLELYLCRQRLDVLQHPPAPPPPAQNG